MDASSRCTVTAIFYGPYPDLARRCLDSILDTVEPAIVLGLRIGLNAACEETRQYVHEALASSLVPALLYDSPVNRMKYPLLRKMLHDPDHPLNTPFVMHFDDDSAIRSNRAWWPRVMNAARSADVMGDLFTKKLEGNQAQGIKAQPWYNGLEPGPKFRFATGGWWVARTAFLQRWDWPFKELKHCGGDTTLGELVRQRGGRLVRFKEGIWINADDRGANAKAKRRGVTQPPLWADYQPDQVPDLSHHDFAIEAVAIG